MKKPDLSRFAPPGFNWKNECCFFLGILGSGLLLHTLFFLFYFYNKYCELYYSFVSVLRPGAMMPPLAEIVHDVLHTPLFFLMGALLGLLTAAVHYASFFQGSRSIYLMRRLPHKGELPLRCLALPLLWFGLYLLALGGLMLLFYALYIRFTPAQCLYPGQWSELWRSLFLCWN